MRFSTLMGSPHKTGNTASLMFPFIDELEQSGVESDCIWLYDKVLKPCVGCGTCQNIFTDFGCPIVDDVQEIFNMISLSDCIILATPIYAWYCTAPMKTLIDRLIYGINKYYGDKPGPALWQGKKIALVTTCGYKPNHGTDLFEEGIKRACKHSKLDYIGMLTARDLGSSKTFVDGEKIQMARAFAKQTIEACT